MRGTVKISPDKEAVNSITARTYRISLKLYGVKHCNADLLTVFYIICICKLICAAVVEPHHRRIRFEYRSYLEIRLAAELIIERLKSHLIRSYYLGAIDVSVLFIILPSRKIYICAYLCRNIFSCELILIILHHQIHAA